MGDIFGFHMRVGLQIVIQPVRPARHDLLQIVRALGVVGLQDIGIGVEALAQIAPDRLLAVILSGDAQIGGVVGFDAVEVIFRLGIDHAEHSVGVGVPLHMGDAIAIPRDLDLGGDSLESCIVAAGGMCRQNRQCGQKRSRSKQARGQMTHEVPSPFYVAGRCPFVAALSIP